MADTDTTISIKRAKPPRSETRETLVFFLKLALIVFVLRSFIVAPFSIPSQSMLPRLYIGDYLFVSKWNYGYSRWSLPWGVPLLPGRILGRDPTRGDVVVFRGPPGNDHDVIKRVIGLPGDTIQMRNGQAILNGVLIPKVRMPDFTIPLSPNYSGDPKPDGQEADCPTKYIDIDAKGGQICRYQQFRETLPNGKSYAVLDRGDDNVLADNTGLYVVPAGHVFVMGDNRDDSGDSRFDPPQGMGYVPMERIEGRAMVSFFSTDGSANWFLPWTWFSAARWSRIGEGF